MAAGRAVVTTDVPGCRETVQQGRNGFLVKVRDSASLAEAMWEFCKDPSLIARMGQASRDIAEEKFDVDKINGEIIANLAV
jgi:glycosyltransferase involved in cell wall biosynthesis